LTNAAVERATLLSGETMKIATATAAALAMAVPVEAQDRPSVAPKNMQARQNADRTAARTWLSDHGDKPSLRWFLQKRNDALT